MIMITITASFHQINPCVFHQFLDRLLRNLNKGFFLAVKEVDVAGVDVEPDGVEFDITCLEFLVQKLVAGQMLKLLQGVDLQTN